MERELKEIIGGFVFNIAQLQNQVNELQRILLEKENELKKLKSHEMIKFPLQVEEDEVKVNEG